MANDGVVYCSSSGRTFASFKSAVSRPPENQSYTGGRRSSVEEQRFSLCHHGLTPALEADGCSVELVHVLNLTGSCIHSKMALEEVSDAIWLAEGEIVSFYGFPYPTRSVVVRFGNGDLWVWSPIRLSAGLLEQVDRLGRVAHLVSPNKIHHLYLQDWKALYPAAHVWGLLSTINKRRDLKFREPLSDISPMEWQPDLGQAWFRGSPAMDEVVFLHRPSRTVIVADLIENFTYRFLREHWRWWQRPLAKLDGITSDKARAPLEWRLSFINRAPAREARDKVLGWNCERVIMAHGEWQRSNGHVFLTRSLDWLGH